MRGVVYVKSAQAVAAAAVVSCDKGSLFLFVSLIQTAVGRSVRMTRQATAVFCLLSAMLLIFQKRKEPNSKELQAKTGTSC